MFIFVLVLLIINTRRISSMMIIMQHWNNVILRVYSNSTFFLKMKCCLIIKAGLYVNIKTYTLQLIRCRLPIYNDQSRRKDKVGSVHINEHGSRLFGWHFVPPRRSNLNKGVYNVDTVFSFITDFMNTSVEYLMSIYTCICIT